MNDIINKLVFILLMTYVYIRPIERLTSYNLDYFQLPITQIMLIGVIVLLFFSFVHLVIARKIYRYNVFPFMLLLIVVVQVVLALSYINDYPNVQNGAFGISTPLEIYKSFIKNNIVQYIVFAFVGFRLNEILKILNKKTVKIFMLLVFVIFSVLIFYTSYANNISLFDSVFKANSENNYYIVISDGISFFLVLLCYSFKNSVLITALSVIILFKIGGRSALYAFLIYALIMFFLNFFNNKTYSKGFFSKASNIIFLLFVILLGSQIIPLVNDRMLALFNLTSLFNDSSYNSRKIIEMNNNNDLVNIFWFGRLFREFKVSGINGHYTHNILSFLNQFGFFTFIGILIGIFRSVFKALILGIKNQLSNYELNSIIGIIFFFLPQVLFSKSYVYPYIWIIIFSYNAIKKTYKG